MRKRISLIAAWLLAPCEYMGRLMGLPYSRFAYAAMLVGSLAVSIVLVIENTSSDVTVATKAWLLVLGLLCYAPITYEAYKMPPEA